MKLDTIGRNIRKFRLAKKLRQEDLAEKTDLTTNYIGMVERGEKIPSLETFIKIVNALGVSSDMVLTDVLETGYTVKNSMLNEKLEKLATNDQHKDLKADFIMANPPFNQKQWRAENELVDDPRWNGYEVPPTSNANYGWILNIVSKLSQNGVAGFLLANGALSDDGTELKIRQQLIENHLVEAIIILPRNLFYTTDISVTLWVLNKNKKARVVEQNGKLKRYRNREDEILFMDLRQMGSPYEKKYIELTEEDRAKVTSVYHNWQQEGYEETYENVPEFCYSASFDEVKEKGFTLVPSRYIEFVNRDENIDFDTKMKSLQGELKELLAQEEKSKEDLLSVFKELGYEIEI